MRILVVEDDDRLARAITTALRHAGYEVLRAPNGAEALAAPPVDLVLLDLGLPDLDGTDVLRELRRAGGPGGGCAVIAVTARSEEASRVRLLRGGADDYVVKPFGAAELLARVEAVLRRTRDVRGAAELGRVTAGALVLDLDQRTAAAAGTELVLTRKEFDLLALLVRHTGGVVRRETLAEQVWQVALPGPTAPFRTLDTHVASLRGKLAAATAPAARSAGGSDAGPGAGAPGSGTTPTIRTERGVGYRLDAADR